MKKDKTMYLHVPFKKKISVNRLLPGISFFMILVYLNLVIGCSYYKVGTLDPLSKEALIEKIQSKKKYIILHYEKKVWHLVNVTLKDADQEMSGSLEPLPSNHMYYLTAKKENRANRLKEKVKEKDNPIHEIHIYTIQNPEDSIAHVIIPFSTITKVEVYDTHVGTTVLTYLGFVGAVAVVIAAIVIATKSSCPFVYINDGNSYHFTGEMYGGAIYSSLERDDYMPLPQYTPTNGKYQLRISNELQERQYTNLASLMVVEHPNNSEVIIDKNGAVQTISSAVLPLSAVSNTHIDFTKTLTATDSNAYLFNEHLQDGRDLSSIILTFKRPLNSNSGKLILNAKNSYWIDYVYGKFNEQFGIYFNTFAEKQKKVPAKKHNQWSLDQNIPLSVYIETKSGWKFVDYFNSIGPLATRDIVMPIDFTSMNDENIKVKLECGFMFWEVDYAAMDFSSNLPIKVNNITSSAATDEHGIEVSNLISATDDNYLIQPEIGNVVTIEYPSTSAKVGNRQTVFLHSRGYYEYIRDYTNLPDISSLQSFKSKGAFTRFSKEKYDEFISTKELFAATLTQINEN